MNKSEYLTDSLEKFVKHMRQERLSEKTIDSYCAIVEKAALIDSRLYRLSNIQIQDFILESASASAQDLKINALKKFYKVNHPEKRIKVFIRPRKDKKLIHVLTKQEALSIIDSISHPKQKAIISGLYFHGLRISEIINLRYDEINRTEGILSIKQGKGRKDRNVPLNREWLTYLEQYYMKMNYGVMYSGNIFQPYSESSIRAIIKRQAKKLGINKNVYPHLLRDSYATHLHEQGIDIRDIQTILGHKKVTTTQKYVHVSKKHISSIKLNTNRIVA